MGMQAGSAAAGPPFAGCGLECRPTQEASVYCAHMNRPRAIRPIPSHFAGEMYSPSTIAASRMAATYCRDTTICAACN